MASVQVAVRVRDFTKDEIDQDCQCIVRVTDKNVGVFNPDTNKEKNFSFDYAVRNL